MQGKGSYTHWTLYCKTRARTHTGPCIARQGLVHTLDLVLQGKGSYTHWTLYCKARARTHTGPCIARQGLVHTLDLVLQGKGSYTHWTLYCKARARTHTGPCVVLFGHLIAVVISQRKKLRSERGQVVPTQHSALDKDIYLYSLCGLYLHELH